MADETHAETNEPKKAPQSASKSKVEAAEVVQPMSVEVIGDEPEWLQYLESSSAWIEFTKDHVIVIENGIIQGQNIDYRTGLRVEHAARIILDVYGYKVSGSVDPLYLAVEEG